MQTSTLRGRLAAAIAASAIVLALAAAVADAGVRPGLRAAAKQPARAAAVDVVAAAAASGLTLATSCAPKRFARGASSHCAVSVRNDGLTPVNVGLTLRSSTNLRFAGATGLTQTGDHRALAGATLAPRIPGEVAIDPGDAPFDYLPLAVYGFDPIAFADPDEGLASFTTRLFRFGGATYRKLAVSTNGYAVVGGGTAADQTSVPQTLPDAARPNGVLAPFWADLTGGDVRIGTVTDGTDTWVVVDWAGVTAKADGSTHSFELWLGVGNDANPAADVSYVYGPDDGAPAATVGAENVEGSRGAQFTDGVAEGSSLVVTAGSDTAGGVLAGSIDARGLARGAAFVRAVVTSSAAPGGVRVTQDLRVTGR